MGKEEKSVIRVKRRRQSQVETWKVEDESLKPPSNLYALKGWHTLADGAPWLAEEVKLGIADILQKAGLPNPLSRGFNWPAGEDVKSLCKRLFKWVKTQTGNEMPPNLRATVGSMIARRFNINEARLLHLLIRQGPFDWPDRLIRDGVEFPMFGKMGSCWWTHNYKERFSRRGGFVLLWNTHAWDLCRHDYGRCWGHQLTKHVYALFNAYSSDGRLPLERMARLMADRSGVSCISQRANGQVYINSDVCYLVGPDADLRKFNQYGRIRIP